MLRLNVERLQQQLRDFTGIQTGGALLEVAESLTVGGPAALGELCEVITRTGSRIPGEVIAASPQEARVMLFRHAGTLEPGYFVCFSGGTLQLPGGPQALGRVMNALGEPIDQQGSIPGPRITAGLAPPVPALDRPRITEPCVTGQRVVDGFLTLGRGQRVGLFAGSGVGKSTLLGEIARHAQVDCNVVALVGERGREVLPFLEDALGPVGRSRSAVFVATAEEPPLARVQAVKSAIAYAVAQRAAGKHVMLFLDSLTRLAHAQREIGLCRGELPGTRGYPPSVFRLLAESLEQLGTSSTGSITALITVLVDGDDLHEPIADAARSILDGHIVLSRKLAERNQFPAIDLAASISRLFREVTDPQQQQAAGKLRNLLATYTRMEDLIRLGMYQPGSSSSVDVAVELLPELEQLCRQELGEISSFDATRQALIALARKSEELQEVTV